MCVRSFVCTFGRDVVLTVSRYFLGNLSPILIERRDFLSLSLEASILAEYRATVDQTFCERSFPMAKTLEQPAAATFAARLVCREHYSREEASRAAQEETGQWPERALLEREIRRWLKLFDPHYALRLMQQRRAALFLMQVAPALDLRLVGPVLSGAATEDDPAELVTRHGDVKEALLTFLNAGFDPEALEKETAFVIRVKEEPVIVHVLRPNAPFPVRSFGELDSDQAPLERAKSVDARDLMRLIAPE